VNKVRLLAAAIGGATILSFTQFPFAATMQTPADYNAALNRASDAYASARDKCDPLAGHGKDMCVVEAKAQERRAKALAETNYIGTITSKMNSRIAIADADLMVAKVACDTGTRQQMEVCVRNAKATNERAVADARARRTAR
jgi:hypothetical protein